MRTCAASIVRPPGGRAMPLLSPGRASDSAGTDEEHDAITSEMATRNAVRARNAVMTTPRIIVRMSIEMKELGFGQRVGQIVQMAYVVEDIRAAMNLWVRDCGVGPWFLL